MDKEEPEKDKYVRICPKCGSTDIGAKQLSKPVYSYYCNSCGYGGLPHTRGFLPIFPEIKSSDIPKFRKKLKNSGKRIGSHSSR